MAHRFGSDTVSAAVECLETIAARISGDRQPLYNLSARYYAAIRQHVQSGSPPLSERRLRCVFEPREPP